MSIALSFYFEKINDKGLFNQQAEQILVERQLKNKTLFAKCIIIQKLEKGMTNKEASEKLVYIKGIFKNTNSTRVKSTKNSNFPIAMSSDADCNKQNENGSFSNSKTISDLISFSGVVTSVSNFLYFKQIYCSTR